MDGGGLYLYGNDTVHVYAYLHNRSTVKGGNIYGAPFASKPTCKQVVFTKYRLTIDHQKATFTKCQSS